jgi:hypothetical protein
VDYPSAFHGDRAELIAPSATSWDVISGLSLANTWADKIEKIA